MATRIKCRNDIGMHQSGRGPHFSIEALDRVLVVRHRARQNLDGHLAVHGAVPGTKDLTHTANTNQLLDLILAKNRRRCG